jgi:putative MFS transporter
MEYIQHNPRLATMKSDEDLSDSEAPILGHRPWWRWVMPWLGRGPRIDRLQSRLLNVLGAANLVDNYDIAILSLALPQIQAGLMIPDEQIGGVSAVIRLGVIPAVCLSALADGVGRRILLLVTILGFTLMTALTSLAQTAGQFMTLQFLARVFIAAEAILAIVVIAEEFGARSRGWGIGVIGAMGALGHAVASLVFALVNILPFGWRAMYLLGIAPLLLLAWFRRLLEETHRFEAHRRSRGRAYDWREALRPFRNLVRMYPGRMLAMCSALFPVPFLCETSVFFASKTLQQVHHYSPADVTLLYLTAGVAAPIGNIVAGVLGDRYGRKWIMVTGLVLNAGAVAAFYNAGGFWAPLAWSMMVFSLMLVNVLFSALGAELFPTSYRSTASGVRAVVAALGASLGLFIEGLLFNRFGSHGAAITAMLLITPIAPVIVVLFLPETASRELEEISPEREAL